MAVNFEDGLNPHVAPEFYVVSHPCCQRCETGKPIGEPHHYPNQLQHLSPPLLSHIAFRSCGQAEGARQRDRGCPLSTGFRLATELLQNLSRCCQAVGRGLGAPRGGGGDLQLSKFSHQGQMRYCSTHRKRDLKDPGTGLLAACMSRQVGSCTDTRYSQQCQLACAL